MVHTCNLFLCFSLAGVPLGPVQSQRLPGLHSLILNVQAKKGNCKGSMNFSQPLRAANTAQQLQRRNPVVVKKGVSGDNYKRSLLSTLSSHKNSLYSILLLKHEYFGET